MSTVHDPEGLTDSWIKDGTQTDEPVTSETPEQEASPQETPPEGAETPPEGQTPAEGTPAEAATQETPPEEFFVGRLDGKEYKIPKAFEIPLKRGDEVEYVPITEQQGMGMREKDYRQKTQNAAELKRELDRKLAEQSAAAARAQAREQVLTQREQQLREMVKDPQGFEQYQEHIELLRSNPLYAQAIEEGLNSELEQADRSITEEQQYESAVVDAVNMARGWIDEVGQEEQFAGVDPERVRARYASELSMNSAPLDRKEVERIFQQEAEYRSNLIASSPLRTELEELRAQLAKVQETQEAGAHNTATQHAINRQSTPNVAPTGSPPAPAEVQRPKPFGIKELDSRISQWARGK
jgi:hypothetical protein